MRWLTALLFCVSAQADWRVLRIPGIEVYTDAPARSGRQTVERLEQIRSLLGSPVKPGWTPLRVILFAKRSEYLDYAPNQQTAGFYQSGVERDYIVTSASVPLDRVVAHEYVHFVSNDREQRAAWLEEGLADFYSTFDGKEVGAPIREHLRRLEAGGWLSAEEMNSSRQKTEVFYAQSWALVHMLRRRPPFPERVTTEMLIELKQYLPSLRPAAVKVSKVATTASEEPVSALNALLVRADLALRTERRGLAKELYSQAAREFPNSSSAATGLAALAFAEGDADGARRQLRRALELNEGDALAWLQAAMIENDRSALEKAVELNPNLTEAHLLLGVRATDDGDFEDALEHLEQAARLTPRKSYAWYSLGYAQLKNGDQAGAKRSLEQALQTAVTAEQRAMAATLLDSLP